MRLDASKIVLAPLPPRFAGCENATEVAEALGAPAIGRTESVLIRYIIGAL
jgi:hypothetical protein